MRESAEAGHTMVVLVVVWSGIVQANHHSASASTGAPTARPKRFLESAMR